MRSKSIEENAKPFLVWTIVSGAVLGLAAVLLVRLGNPLNMGVCSACFLRDVAGGLNLFAAPAGLQYLRPEVPGFLLGAFAAALLFREFKSSGGASPLLRFILGAFVMIGAMVFMGCPIRCMLRLGGGDYTTALVGLGGLIAGIGVASFFIARGFTLGTGKDQPRLAGFVAPLMGIGLVLFILHLAFGKDGDPKGLIQTKWHAPLLASLGIAFVIGIFAQRSRFCSVGGFRDVMLGNGWRLLYGYIALFVAVLAGNLLIDLVWLGGRAQFQWGVSPAAHHEHLWNFLGLFLVGLGAVLVGGCPFRLLMAAGQGNADAALTLMGLLFGAAFCHNFGLIAKPDTLEAAGGPTFAAMTAVVLGIVVCVLVGHFCRPQRKA
jgi:YedE family putative selenium metabolism protein